jgi:hypothetical protein
MIHSKPKTGTGRSQCEKVNQLRIVGRRGSRLFRNGAAVTSLLVGVVSLSVLPDPAPADASSPHRLTATASLVTLSSSKNFPAVGSKSVDLALGQCTPGGTVVAANYFTVTAQKGSVLTSTGTTIDYFAGGSLKSTFKLSFEIQPDGSITGSGTGRFDGGTGTYRHATGHYTFTGVQPAKSMVFTDHSTGTLYY